MNSPTLNCPKCQADVSAARAATQPKCPNCGELIQETETPPPDLIKAKFRGFLIFTINAGLNGLVYFLIFRFKYSSFEYYAFAWGVLIFLLGAKIVAKRSSKLLNLILGGFFVIPLIVFVGYQILMAGCTLAGVGRL